MSTVDEIKEAIQKLSFSQRAELERWLHGWTDDDWDRQIASDVSSGKLDRLLNQIDADIDGGKLRDLP